MKRNMKKIADSMRGKIPGAYQMSMSEWIQLARMARGPEPSGVYDAVIMAFRYGFALAQRLEKNTRKAGKTV